MFGSEDMRFQSLFWWNVLLKGRGAVLRWGSMQFQSLFWWNVLLKWACLLVRTSTRQVSILVLVECTSEL